MNDLPHIADVAHRRRMRFGAALRERGVDFRLWAPNHDAVRLDLGGDQTRSMTRLADGWHETFVEGASPGARYRFVLSDGISIPDPASRFQPEDVHGPSEVVDPLAYRWGDSGWRGRPWEETVLYELHTGAFTEPGTFLAAIAKLDHLASLGVTAIELMPLADFPGRWNWGYDGVQLFAPDASYGRPEDLKALVDAAHWRGLMVLLDVVYNHFGPGGNYWPAIAPIFTERHHTPWGAAVNFDAEGSEFVRALIVENACYWIEEFHLDGLRLDAVHAIRDESEQHVLTEIAAAVRSVADGREVHLLLENEENQAGLIGRTGEGKPEHYTAQWNDDLHHVLHVAASGERSAYYAEYHDDPEKLGRALAEGFAFQGEEMRYRNRSRGEPSAGLPPTAFVGFIQNHDQVGNRAFGDRLTSIAPREAVRAVAAIYLLCPQVPMLFMGEEWASDRPFLFFSDFAGDLADAVRNGRRAEFARFPEFSDPATRERIPDPQNEATFQGSKLDWAAIKGEEHAKWLAFYRSLLAIRRREIVPRLFGMGGHSGSYEILGRGGVRVNWKLGDGSLLTLVANLSPGSLAYGKHPAGRRIYPEAGPAGDALPPWMVLFSVAERGRDAG